MAASADDVQARLLRSIKDVTGDLPLLPWPFQLLQQIGQAIVGGRSSFVLEPTGKEGYLDDLLAAREIREEVVRFNREIEDTFSKYHAQARQQLQAQLRSMGVKEDFGSARDFLEQQWIGSESRRIFAEVTWTALDLPGQAPVEILEQNEAWRLLLDAEGAAAYERAVAKVQPKKAHRLDVLQLVYLANAQRRVLVTADRGLVRIGEAVLRSRYANARVVSLEEMIAA